jgi:hypothetical protein
MKKVFFAIIATVITTVSFAQGKFEAAMGKGLAQYGAAKTAAEYVEIAALFERIADAEKTQWIPYYYAAQALVQSGWMDNKADKDKIGEKAKDLIAKGMAIETNADLYCTQQQVAVLQMMVDPMSRFQSYGAIGREALEKAKKVDATNPRIYYLDGMTVKNTPEAFGGGKAAAKVLFEKSVALFQTYKPASPFHPNWGKEMAEKELASLK